MPWSLSWLVIDLAAATQSENDAGTLSCTFQGLPSGIAHVPPFLTIPAALSSWSALAGSTLYWSRVPSWSPSQALAELPWMPVVVTDGVPASGEAIFVTCFLSIRYARARRTCTLSYGLRAWLNAMDAATGE